jgi:glycosyltransferase involved in cell wall biosynthesis
MKQPDLQIVYIRPARGGIADYGLQIEAIYRQLGYAPKVITVGNSESPRSQVQKLTQLKPDLYHFEIGASSGNLFELSRQLLRRTEVPQLATIHDPGVVVWSPYFVAGTMSASSLNRFMSKVYRKALVSLLGRARIQNYLDNPKLTKLYLRPDCATGARSYYLPQPTYHQNPVKPPTEHRPTTVGFGGFWGKPKGLETLLDAWELPNSHPGLRLVVGGSTADAEDSYARAIKQRLSDMAGPITITGFVANEELDPFLQSLGVLVLPYWPELPNGTSAMAMRAAELAVPIIASDVPALRQQLGDEGARYVRPKDATELAAAIKELAEDPEPFRKRALATQSRLFADHNWDAVGKSLQYSIGIIQKNGDRA